MPSILWVAVATLVTTTALLPLLLRLLRHRNLVDVPSHRSLHDQPTPRGAGIALAAGMAAGLVVAGDVPWPAWLGVVGFAAIGAWDDLSRRPVGIRFLAQLLLAVIIAIGLAAITGSLLWAAIGGSVILLATVNAVNFMDGINGITGLHAIVWGLTYLLALTAVGIDELAPLAVALAAAGVAFLPWNLPHARLFLGDSGSYLIGATAGMLAIAGAMSGHLLAFLGPLATYAADTGFAVFRRLRNGERLTEAHRSHVFQRLVAAGWSHPQTALVTAGFTATSAGLALAALTSPLMVQVVLAVGIIVVNGLYLALPSIVRTDPA